MTGKQQQKIQNYIDYSHLFGTEEIHASLLFSLSWKYYRATNAFMHGRSNNIIIIKRAPANLKMKIKKYVHEYWYKLIWLYADKLCVGLPTSFRPTSKSTKSPTYQMNQLAVLISSNALKHKMNYIIMH